MLGDFRDKPIAIAVGMVYNIADTYSPKFNIYYRDQS